MSLARRAFNAVMRRLGAPRMLYGWQHVNGTWLAHTRLHASTQLEAPGKLDIADHVYIGPFNLIDASGGLTIEEGVQITSHCAVLTHSSHHALRLAGRAYWGHPNPPGFVRAPVHVGAYSFIGAHSVLMPGCRIGKHVIVRAFSYVDGEVPDHAIVGGQPATVVGDTREADAAFSARRSP